MTSKTSNFTRLVPGRIAVLVAGVLAGLTGVANAAQPGEDVPSVTVSYGDLDLTSAAGTRALYRRIAAAARQVCPDPNPGDMQQVASMYACREAAIARAIRDINNPQLAAVLQASPRG